jgi:protease-4
MSEILTNETPQAEPKTPPPTSWVNTPADDSWERDLLNRLAFATLNEQRRARRWRIFFVFLFFIYLFLIYFTFQEANFDWLEQTTEGVITGEKHTALIEINGVIDAEAEANADRIIAGLRRAFDDKDTAGVIIRINSPGGSPVQAGYINDEIKRLRAKHENIPVYAVATDLCASGGYYIAVAADEIYADKATVIGSIGVLMSSFGFVEAMNKMGIERRLLTAGENKGFLDPFSPQKQADMDHINQILKVIHEQFIQQVKQGREKSLTAKGKLTLLDNPKLFSGLVWSGEQAVELGLVDALGSSSYVAREVIKAERIKNFTPKANYLDRFAERLGATIANTIAQQVKFNGSAIH